MKYFRISIATAAIAGLLISCSANMDRTNQSFDNSPAPSPGTSTAPSSGSGYYAKESAKMSADEADGKDLVSKNNTELMSSSAAAGNNADTSHQFIRTADVRFRVNEVRPATFAIEKITAKFGGYVAHTGLESVIDIVKHTPISDDSTLITTYYTVSNNMTLRVPAENLDSTLRSLGTLVEYLDYRRINVEDATLRILREKLAARRIAYSNRRLEKAADGSEAKLRDVAAVEEALFNKQTMADESLLRTLELKDQIELSTITLQIYQRQAWKREMVANEKNIDAYKPGFFHDLGEAIARGWQGLLTLIVGLAHLWPLLIIVLGLVIAIRLIQRRMKK
ncbi:MAG: DUF4349 domain-containing protein [Bacteroidetes bacterium]|nr:DUF4349 domain-containing protein [Bacteroidota bacterium]